MQVAAAHAGRLHLQHHIMRPRKRIVELHELQLAVAGEYDAAHGRLPWLCFVSYAALSAAVEACRLAVRRKTVMRRLDELF
jgi:hypothetical protein